MTDPLGLIGDLGGPARDASRLLRPPATDGPSFKDVLSEQIEQVSDLQRRAEEAIEDLASGRRDDFEGVMIATQKADTAFRMLLQVRNKVMDAYEEIKQIRV